MVTVFPSLIIETHGGSMSPLAS